MSIVVGTDFSDASKPALRTAAALAARLPGSELHLVHVIEGDLVGELTAGQRHELKVQLATKLEAFAKEVVPSFDAAKLQTAVLSGQPGTELADFAERKGADLLVVASRGHSQSSLLRLGGVSERVTSAAGVPSLVVRDERPFVAWLEGGRRLRTLVGVDWTASCQPAIDLVKALCKIAPCDVVAGHVYYGTDGFSRYGLPGTRSWVARDAETEKLIRRDLEERVGRIPDESSLSFEPTLGIGRAGGHLIDLAEAQRADLVVVGTHQRRGPLRLGSVSSVVLHDSRASVLCAPPKTPRADEVPAVRRVLVATDLSPASNVAIPHGYALLTGRTGGVVHLLHVAQPLDAPRSARTEDPELLAKLGALTPEWAERYGIETVPEVVRRSDVARAIRAVAARVGADVVCMASRGKSGVTRLVLGSIAEEVMRDETRPVLVVRQPA